MFGGNDDADPGVPGHAQTDCGNGDPVGVFDRDILPWQQDRIMTRAHRRDDRDTQAFVGRGQLQRASVVGQSHPSPGQQPMRPRRIRSIRIPPGQLTPAESTEKLTRYHPDAEHSQAEQRNHPETFKHGFESIRKETDYASRVFHEPRGSKRHAEGFMVMRRIADYTE